MKNIKTMLGSNPKLFIRLASVSPSGMTRSFDCYIIHENDIVNVNYEVSAYASKRRNSSGSVIMRGCGMDMAFALTYELSSLLYNGDGYKLKHVVL